MVQVERTFLFFAFAGVTIITAAIVLLANVGYFGETVRTGDFAKWGLGAVLVEIVGATVAAYRWNIITPKRIKIVFEFKLQGIETPIDSSDIHLEECPYEVLDAASGEAVDKGKAIPFREMGSIGSGAWQCFIKAEKITENHVVRMIIRARGRQEMSIAFPPLTKTELVFVTQS